MSECQSPTPDRMEEIRALRKEIGRGSWTDINLIKALACIDELLAAVQVRDELIASLEECRRLEAIRRDGLREDAERYRALRKWHDAPGIPEFDLDEGADALIAASSVPSGAKE